jgi:hypothetical protein
MQDSTRRSLEKVEALIRNEPETLAMWREAVRLF